MENEAGQRIGIAKGILLVFSKLCKNFRCELTTVRIVSRLFLKQH